ncbi:uncharacterized protein GLRG_08330 [Colletotrichum graminicola M1.001]|uniref:Uncharacterized protein n=1 Tax=Colletotrichum graminicola (strain M1.001 / M2 / FGSC 10212) TaxID=645133 RepID=E3QQP8_COLGM|nr:uncharacterized protein GLRG_08330 [Colletotrichum graminicola M1.001]EFQ33186.1 hypothetical protein GLRG_08330 [Colletotrichum graminicola M1.001]
MQLPDRITSNPFNSNKCTILCNANLSDPDFDFFRVSTNAAIDNHAGKRKPPRPLPPSPTPSPPPPCATGLEKEQD